jgi:predicted nucleic acid-binding protein
VLVISDTNILSSLAAGEAFHLLYHLFPDTVIYIPPAVHKELQAGLARGQAYLEVVLQAIDSHKLEVLDLSTPEQHLAQTLPQKLNAGECEAIALSQNRKAYLLSNDKRVVRYCKEMGIKVVDLPILLRWLWTRRIISREEVKVLLQAMETVENLRLSQNALEVIFAPRRRRKS